MVHKVAVIVGSIRRDSINRKLAGALAKLAEGKLDMEILRIDDLPLFNQDDEASPTPPVTRFKDAVKAADAVLFVTPEHNRSIPAAMKNAIDWATRPSGQSALRGKVGGHHRDVEGPDFHRCRPAASAHHPAWTSRRAPRQSRGLCAIRRRHDRRDRRDRRRGDAKIPHHLHRQFCPPGRGNGAELSGCLRRAASIRPRWRSSNGWPPNGGLRTENSVRCTG